MCRTEDRKAEGKEGRQSKATGGPEMEGERVGQRRRSGEEEQVAKAMHRKRKKRTESKARKRREGNT